MTSSRSEWQNRPDGSVWIIGMKLSPTDVDKLRDVRYLTLHDTSVPAGFFERLPQLELLDLRGAKSVTGVPALQGLDHLRGLSIRNARGLPDLQAVSMLTSLEFLDLYALPAVSRLPAMDQLIDLRRLNIGQMIRLTDWSGLLSAPRLEVLELANKLTPDDDVLAQLATRSTFRHFVWSAPDEALSTVERATRAADRSRPNYVRIVDLWSSNRSE